MTDPTGLAEHVERLGLVDHHVHAPFAVDGDDLRLGTALNEADPDPPTDPATAWDTQLGFAVRARCAEVLDLAPHPSPADYLDRRRALGENEVGRRFLTAAGVSDWLVDTGYRSPDLLDLPAMAALSSGRTHEVLRLETLAERLVTEIDRSQDYAEAFTAALGAAAPVAAKTVLAYRGGFDVDLTPPSAAEVTAAVGRWTDQLEAEPHRSPRLTDPVLIAYGIDVALRQRLSLQVHVGYGDRDLDLRLADPLLLTDFLRTPAAQRAPILLLHCYPYERQAGYLAQAFPQVHLDVGLAVHHLGAASTGVVARSLELAPFGKLLYSSDACGPPEFHYLGARLWRRAISRVLGGWVTDGDWSEADAVRVATMVGRENAERVYGLAART